MRDEPVQPGYYGIPPGDDIFGPQPTERVRMSTTLSPRANPYGTGFFGRAPGGERGPMCGSCPMGPPPGRAQQPQQQQKVPLQQQQVPQQFPQQVPQAPQVSLEQVLQQQIQLLNLLEVVEAKMVHHESVVWILNGSRPLLLQSGKTGAHVPRNLAASAIGWRDLAHGCL